MIPSDCALELRAYLDPCPTCHAARVKLAEASVELERMASNLFIHPLRIDPENVIDCPSCGNLGWVMNDRLRDAVRKLAVYFGEDLVELIEGGACAIDPNP